MSKTLSATLMTICILAFCASAIVEAQSSSGQAESDSHSHDGDSHEDDKDADLKKALDALRSETKTLKNQMKNEKSPNPPGQTTLPSMEPPETQIPIQTDRLLQIQKIKKRISILRRMTERTAEAVESPLNKNGTPIRNVNSSTTVEPLRGNMDWQNQPPKRLPETEDLTEISVSRVIEGVVDQFELANSLFEAGQIQVALEAYDKVQTSQLTVYDATWHEYMTATCHRLLNNTETSESIYRTISKGSPVELPVKAARWWLGYLDQKKNIKQAYINLDEQATTLLELADTHVNNDK